ncbi:MAG: hypothetical protein IKO35_02855 [Elusimicrobiaceae bacterium]|nr:hypothetical protein [Elusimicrobiaceae bacterium]
MTTYYIEKDNQIVLHDTDRNRLVTTLKYMPQYAGLEIQETQRPIENGEWADTPQYIAQKQIAQIAAQVTDLEVNTGLLRPIREMVLTGGVTVSAYVRQQIQEIETLAVALRGGGMNE